MSPTRSIVCRIRIVFPSLYLDHFEIFLAGATVGARPVHRHVLPLRSRCDAVLGRAELLIVNPAANQAHVFFHSGGWLSVDAGRLEVNCDFSSARRFASSKPAIVASSGPFRLRAFPKS